MSTVTVTPIKTEADYQNALRRIDELLTLAPAPYSELDDELDVISTLVHAYEQTHHAIPYPDPINAIKYLMEENGWKSKDLEQFIGPKSRVSEILNRKRYFTLQQILNLHKHLGLPLEVFINEKMPQAIQQNSR
ncbi:helix-turn-helix domain-containing protein [Dyadobacter aurulentus]|uniref:helix-turn-helix domain-containing protein n=1 Tax=Dyadobacter sp. UC 10 TaxID=2605428 RepID=UPI0011F37290|nr:transcriptional regulator [Dyadobacter sp. UC 10]KAA0989101.1 transcriptional regulator [Dyadobacter sp. UC 10]